MPSVCAAVPQADTLSSPRDVGIPAPTGKGQTGHPGLLSSPIISTPVRRGFSLMAGRSYCSPSMWRHPWLLGALGRPPGLQHYRLDPVHHGKACNSSQRKFPAASPVAVPESPGRHGRPVPPRLLMQGPHKHTLHHCRAPKQVSAFQPASQTRHPPGQLCCAYTDVNPRGSPCL